MGGGLCAHRQSSKKPRSHQRRGGDTGDPPVHLASGPQSGGPHALIPESFTPANAPPPRSMTSRLNSEGLNGKGDVNQVWDEGDDWGKKKELLLVPNYSD